MRKVSFEYKILTMHEQWLSDKATENLSLQLYNRIYNSKRWW